MTRCLNLVAIAAVAMTTFLSTFAHGLNVKLTDKDGNTYSYTLGDLDCQNIPEGITAVSGKTDAESCSLFQSSNCASSFNDFVSFSGTKAGTTVQNFEEYTAKSISCEEFI
ncbi:hypothetical protein DFQ26_007189 [Actinomortierella ambigua]|nr:hypothetical protein DFQ26_007189 [Actinomortierella ambigua]